MGMTEYAKMPQAGEIKLLATMHWSAVVMGSGEVPEVTQVKKHYADLLSKIGKALGPENGKLFAEQYDAALTGIASQEGSEWG